MAGDILKGLPSFDKENFANFKADESIKSTSARAISYIHTDAKDQEESQVIITDKTNILLRYLRKQLDSKKPTTKRGSNSTNGETPSNAKVPRLDPDDND